jgi:hypothetical protein
LCLKIRHTPKNRAFHAIYRTIGQSCGDQSGIGNDLPQPSRQVAQSPPQSDGTLDHVAAWKSRRFGRIGPQMQKQPRWLKAALIASIIPQPPLPWHRGLRRQPAPFRTLPAVAAAPVQPSDR